MREVHLSKQSPSISEGLSSRDPWAGCAVPWKQIDRLYGRLNDKSPSSFLNALLEELHIACEVSDTDLQRIPCTGPLVAVANHPFGMLDGALLASTLGRVRSDVKVLTNYLLGGIPELRDSCIFVDPYGSDRAVHGNGRALREAISWLRQGGALAVFPAGEVSHLQWKSVRIEDPEWNRTAARLARMTAANVLPVFFSGHNSLAFQFVGLLHPQLRTAWLMNELLRQSGHRVQVRIGCHITREMLSNFADDHAAIRYLRNRTYLLDRRRRQLQLPPVKFIFRQQPQEALVPEVPRQALAEEISGLSPSQRLFENEEFLVAQASAEEIPSVMREIGRLRELTFRAVGEGTGLESDIDRFDSYYQQLILWSKHDGVLVGGYRIGKTAEILEGRGIDGLYTSTLFRYASGFFTSLGPALELGRSFIRPEYQKKYSPLLVLWKGIGRYVAAFPEAPTLFGVVSISNRYSKSARHLMYRFLTKHQSDRELSRLVVPRRPFRPSMWNCDSLYQPLSELDHINDLVSDLEMDGKGVPILLKHYSRLGGRLAAFNVDVQFTSVLDGLIVVDLRRADSALVDRYLGKDGARAFRRHHKISEASSQ